MKDICHEILIELEKNIFLIEKEFTHPINSSEKIIEVILIAISEVKKNFLKKKDLSQEEEIYFFKIIKPLFVSKLIYYNNIFRIESGVISYSTKEVIKYLKKESYKIKGYYKENKEFNRYHRTSNDSFDHIYFTRNKNNIKLNLESFVFERDPKFTTSHDFKLATIIANDETLTYLEDKIIKLENIGKNTFNKSIIPASHIKWTGTNTEFTELVYALYFNGNFNNGKADIKEIATVLEQIFNFQTDEIYRTWYAIKNRKKDPTIFLDNLKISLQTKIEESFNK